MLKSQDFALGYGARLIIHPLSLEVPSCQITALIGPNGCGKSTLLRGLARILPPQSGAVILEGRRIHELPTREVAKALSILPQTNLAPEGLTVRELCQQGRYPHQRWLQQWSSADEQAVAAALRDTGMSALADHAVDALSGGQRQRAWIAMTLAQQSRILLLDEPTTYLDMGHAIEVMELLGNLRKSGHTIVMVVHDLNLAARHAQHLIALKAGAVYAQGSPQQVLTSQLLLDVFDVHADIVMDARLNVPLCLPWAVVQR